MPCSPRRQAWNAARNAHWPRVTVPRFHALLQTIIARLMKMLTRRGVLV